MKFCEIIIIIKYTFVVLVLHVLCPKKEEATRDRRKLNNDDFDGFCKQSGDRTKEVERDGVSLLRGKQGKCIQWFCVDL